MGLLLVVALYLSSSGCIFYDSARQLSASADILEEQAAILKLYRLCLEKYQDEPAKAKSQCEHYTQSLQAIDVRGLK